jgi:hypothetical protein
VSALAAARRRSAWLVLVSLALLLAMRESIPNYDGMTGPIVERGVLGEWKQARRFAARADAVLTARAIRTEKTGVPESLSRHDTSGVWLVVDATAKAVDEPVSIGKAQILTRDGRRYARTERLGSTRQLSGAELQPGIESRGVLVFELPADQVAGATLVLADSPIAILDSELRLDLRLAAAPAPREFYDLVRR